MRNLFVYGTLCHLPLLRVVAGEDVQVRPASLAGWHVSWSSAGRWPMIAEAEGVAEGLLLTGLTKQARDRIDFYESLFGYPRMPVSVQVDAEIQEAEIYIPPSTGVSAAGPWRLQDWLAEEGDLAMETARRIMAMHGRRPADEIARRMTQIRATAQAALNARQSGPTTLRRNAEVEDVVVHDYRMPYAYFFAVEEFDLSHRQTDGSMGQERLTRAAFISGDAAVVLPYDPGRDMLLLTEQFRMGPFARGDRQCWSLEAAAGRIDPGETPEGTARREAAEETGLVLSDLIDLGGYYPSPGAKAEYLYNYLALCDLPEDAINGPGGKEDEGEDIRLHRVTYDHAMNLVASGEINNGPLILILLKLGQMRADLRSAAC